MEQVLDVSPARGRDKDHVLVSCNMYFSHRSTKHTKKATKYHICHLAFFRMVGGGMSFSL